jgi:hypothetical protein
VDDREGLPWSDERIWVTLKPDWTPDRDLKPTVHPGDIAGASPEARLWLDGFLCGQEAGLFEFLGSSVELLDMADDDDDVVRWKAWNAGFRRRGWAPRLQTMPSADPALDELPVPQPWVYVGGRFWVWQAGAWVVEDPQPAGADADSPGWARPGGICAQRGHHLYADFGSFSACEDCHHVI